MSEQTTLMALQTFFQNATTFPTLAGVYLDSPPLPFDGPYPIVVLEPDNQDQMTESQMSDYLVGYYRVRYFDELGDDPNNLTSVGVARAKARAFAAATRNALRANYTLGGAVGIAGKGNPGTRALYGAIQAMKDDSDLPIYEFVQLVLVRGLLES